MLSPFAHSLISPVRIVLVLQNAPSSTNWFTALLQLPAHALHICSARMGASLLWGHDMTTGEIKLEVMRTAFQPTSHSFGWYGRKRPSVAFATALHTGRVKTRKSIWKVNERRRGDIENAYMQIWDIPLWVFPLSASSTDFGSVTVLLKNSILVSQ